MRNEWQKINDNLWRCVFWDVYREGDLWRVSRYNVTEPWTMVFATAEAAMQVVDRHCLAGRLLSTPT